MCFQLKFKNQTAESASKEGRAIGTDIAENISMATQSEIRMIRDFGFSSEADLNSKLSLVKGGVILNNPGTAQRLWKKRDFKWRIKFLSKYHILSTQGSSIASKISSYYDSIENAALKYCSGSYVYTSTPKAEKQYQWLTNRLVRPWKLVPHGRLLSSIQGPNNYFHFKAIDYKQLIEALDICYKLSKRSGAAVKPYPLYLDWNECKSSFLKKYKAGSFIRGFKYTFHWTADLTLALLICANICKTWNTKTGDWKPYNNAWMKLVHKELHQQIRDGTFGFVSDRGWKGGLARGLNSALRAAGTAKKGSVKPSVKFDHIVDFIAKKHRKRMDHAAIILRGAFVGGWRGTKVINSVHEQYGYPKWWEKKWSLF